MDSNSHIQIAEVYAVKQDSLVDSCTIVLLDILIQKRDRWILSSNSSLATFIGAHPNKRWHKRDETKFASPNFETFDLPMCSKWLLEFLWHPHETGLTRREKESVEKLRNIRHEKSHKGPGVLVPEREYLDNCEVVRECLEVLGLRDSKINEVIRKANAVTLVNKDEILNQIQTVSDNQWTFKTLGVLGGGCFGVVIEVRCLDGRSAALKMVPNQRGRGVSKDDLKEAKNLATLEQHPNIVKYITSNFFNLSSKKFQEIIAWESGGNPIYPDQTHRLISASLNAARTLSGCYIQTEVCGETLRAWLKAHCPSPQEFGEYTQADKYRICEDIMAALDYIHNANPGNVVVHRDLRPDNIYFAKCGYTFPIKIGDFGLSSAIMTYEDTTLTLQAGNTFYRAPEVNHPHPSSPTPKRAKYGTPADLYSAGLIFSEVFDPVHEDQLVQKLEQIRYDRNTGIVKEKYPLVSETILSMTERNNPDGRYPRGMDGRYLPLSWRNAVIPQSNDALSFATSTANANAGGMTTPAEPEHERLIRQLSLGQRRLIMVSERTSVAVIGGQHESEGNTPVNYLQNRSLAPNTVGQTHGTPVAATQLQSVVPAPNLDPTEFWQAHADRPEPRITALRKELQMNKTFWTAEVLANFFGRLTGTACQTTEFAMAGQPVKSKPVNSKLYGLRDRHPNLLTKRNLKRALREVGFHQLAAQIDNLHLPA